MKKILMSLLLSLTVLFTVGCKPSDKQMEKVSDRMKEVTEAVDSFDDAKLPENIPNSNSKVTPKQQEAMDEYFGYINNYLDLCDSLGINDDGTKTLNSIMDWIGGLSNNNYQNQDWEYTDPETGYYYYYDSYLNLYYCYISNEKFYQYDPTYDVYFYHDPENGYYSYYPSLNQYVFGDPETGNEYSYDAGAGIYQFYDNETNSYIIYNERTGEYTVYDENGMPPEFEYDENGIPNIGKNFD